MNAFYHSSPISYVEAVVQETKKAVISYVFSKSALITPGAAEILSSTPDFRSIVDEALSRGHFFITEDIVKSILAEREEKEETETSESIPLQERTEVGEKEVIVLKTGFKPIAKEYEANIRFFEEYDVTGKSYCEGTVDDFIRYFRDRFERLRSILRKRPNTDIRPISRLDRVSTGQEVHVIGMVYDVRESKKGHLILEIEDEEERTTLVVPKDSEIRRKAKYILPDDVLLFKVVRTSGGLYVVRDFFWPDVEEHTPHYADVDLAVAITSDWHVGSRLFIEKALKKFIDWLHGRVGNERLKELAGKVKYVIVNGDVVDGVGVYPSQIDELVIKDIEKQYEAAAQYIAEMPDWVEVLVNPGNHDAVRRLEPQPALSKEVAYALYELDNVHMLGSPTYYALERVEFLVYHGTSMDEVISRVPGLDYAEPERALEEFLRRRHLVPTYGVKQPIVPERRDYMLIERVPDVFACGHVHKNGYRKYKGVRLVVSGTFQEQTPFQLEMGHIPTPGVIPILTLSDLAIHQLKVYNGGNNGTR